MSSHVEVGQKRSARPWLLHKCKQGQLTSFFKMPFFLIEYDKAIAPCDICFRVLNDPPSSGQPRLDVLKSHQREEKKKLRVKARGN